MPTWLDNVLQYLLTNWEPVIAYLSALGTAIAYFLSRRREASWKRTEFLFSIGKELDQDVQIQQILMILEGRNPNIAVDAIFDADSSIEAPKRGELQQAFDRLLNFLERLHHAVVETKTLSLAEADNFGWYFERILQSQRLVKYCDDNGFGDVLELGRMLQNFEA